MIVLGAGDIRAAQTAADGDLHALGASLHGPLDALLHRAAESNALFQLLGDVFSDQLRIGVGVLHVHHADVHGVAHELFHFGLQVFDTLAAAADDHAGLAGEERDGHAGRAALDINAADAGGIKLFLQHFPQFEILDEVVGKILLAGVPAGAPIEDHAHARAMRINFLTHV